MRLLSRVLTLACVVALTASVAHAQSLVLYRCWRSQHVGQRHRATDWGTTPGGPYSSLWSSGSDAHFEGTAGIVNVSGTISSVNSISFDIDGYTLSGGSINLTGTGGSITTGSGADTIGSVLGGSVGLTKLGTGTLTLSGANTYTGGTNLSAGTVQVQGTETPGTSGPLGESGQSRHYLNGGTLQYSSNNNYDYSSRFSHEPPTSVQRGHQRPERDLGHRADER